MLPLSHLVNRPRCLCEGVFRDVLKTARVAPVYEKGSQDLPASAYIYGAYTLQGAWSCDSATTMNN